MIVSDRTGLSVARPAPRINTVLAWWTASLLLLLAFGLGDVAVVAWSANVVTSGELLAGWLAFFLITFGIMVTICKVKA
jgi:hypothetical protein